MVRSVGRAEVLGVPCVDVVSWFCHFRSRKSWHVHSSLRFQSCFHAGFVDNVESHSWSSALAPQSSTAWRLACATNPFGDTSKEEIRLLRSLTRSWVVCIYFSVADGREDVVGSHVVVCSVLAPRLVASAVRSCMGKRRSLWLSSPYAGEVVSYSVLAAVLSCPQSSTMAPLSIARSSLSAGLEASPLSACSSLGHSGPSPSVCSMILSQQGQVAFQLVSHVHLVFLFVSVSKYHPQETERKDVSQLAPRLLH